MRIKYHMHGNAGMKCTTLYVNLKTLKHRFKGLKSLDTREGTIVY